MVQMGLLRPEENARLPGSWGVGVWSRAGVWAWHHCRELRGTRGGPLGRPEVLRSNFEELGLGIGLGCAPGLISEVESQPWWHELGGRGMGGHYMFWGLFPGDGLAGTGFMLQKTFLVMCPKPEMCGTWPHSSHRDVVSPVRRLSSLGRS